MKKYKTDFEGAISLYLCLVIVILVPIIVSIYEAARYSAMKLQVECAVDISMDSILAEYNRELLDEYGLLFVDSGYGNGSGSVLNVNDHLSDYLSLNLEPNRPLLLKGSRDLLGLKLESSNITKYSRATDENGKVFRYMALSYMLEYYGYSYITEEVNMCEKTSSSGLLDINIDNESSAAQSKLSGFSVSDEEREEYGLEDDLEYDDPSEGLEKAKSKGILALVCRDNVSSKNITPEKYVTGRQLSVGNGYFENWKSRDSMLDECMFNEYIMIMCGNYIEQKYDGLLDYQVEYIISGKSNDTDNLKDIAGKILLIRGGANTLYFLGSYHMEEANALAEALAALCGFPPLAPLFEAVIVTTWIYAESIYDVKQIMHGGRVPLITTEESWDLGIEKAIDNTYETLTGEANVSGEGMNYQDFLRVFLYLMDSKTKNMRTMDIIEMDIRKHTDNAGFRMDDCIAAFELQTVITSKNGYEFLVDKEFSYY